MYEVQYSALQYRTSQYSVLRTVHLQYKFTLRNALFANHSCYGRAYCDQINTKAASPCFARSRPRPRHACPPHRKPSPTATYSHHGQTVRRRGTPANYSVWTSTRCVKQSGRSTSMCERRRYRSELPPPHGSQLTRAEKHVDRLHYVVHSMSVTYSTLTGRVLYCCTAPYFHKGQYVRV